MSADAEYFLKVWDDLPMGSRRLRAGVLAATAGSTSSRASQPRLQRILGSMITESQAAPYRREAAPIMN
jgi:hypothetical protein